MKAALLFYRGFCIAPIAISLIHCILLFNANNLLFSFALFPSKAITNILIGVFINVFRAEQFYFFHNLGLTKIQLFALSFLFDVILWAGLLTVVALFQ